MGCLAYMFTWYAHRRVQKISTLRRMHLSVSLRGSSGGADWSGRYSKLVFVACFRVSSPELAVFPPKQ